MQELPDPGRAALTAQEEGRRRAAWERLVRRFAPYVHTTAVRGYALPERDAEDVFQEVFVKTWARLGDFAADDDIEGYIIETTRAAAESRGDPVLQT